MDIRKTLGVLTIAFIVVGTIFLNCHAAHAKSSKLGISITVPFDSSKWKTHGTVTVYAETYDADVYSVIDNSVTSIDESTHNDNSTNVKSNVKVNNTQTNVNVNNNHTNIHNNVHNHKNINVHTGSLSHNNVNIH